jgi:hypothetical protein
MSLELQIIRLQEFIRLGPSGNFDLRSSKEALALLAAACLKRGIHQALMDLRALQPGPKPVFSPEDLVSLVSTFREIGFTSQHRVAVLYLIDPHERARMFASMARLRGWAVRAFEDFEQAVAWLSEGTEAQPEAQPALTTRKRRVPVQKVKLVQKPSPFREGAHPIIHKKPHTSPRPSPMQPARQRLQAGVRTSPNQ